MLHDHGCGDGRAADAILARLLASSGIAWWLTAGNGFVNGSRGGRAMPTAIRMSGPQMGRFPKLESDGLRFVGLFHAMVCCSTEEIRPG
jgi:hypothetical protein